MQQGKRVNVFTNDIDIRDEGPKEIGNAVRDFCERHNRYCGPNHERFYILEEKRWMHSWEEYKYVTSPDYYVDVPVFHCAATIDRRCIMCEAYMGEHLVVAHKYLEGKLAYQCRTKFMRKWHNKYTHHIVGLPTIMDTDEMYNSTKTA